ncbi:hypothetical protein [Herpetosiphon geysericola]|uniref:Glucosyltransferase-I n=1 Tax=Herpetosiphon geysericola TaxID=70996 RepID=A0A0P6XMY1_9CHLR|nr:hypothetical protein [Herpetosiphon geysericola]KPL81708.1 hypothetical protein SE18_20715 [Herpetosiphon geysericola]
MKIIRRWGSVLGILVLFSWLVSAQSSPTHAMQPSEANNGGSWSNDFAAFGANINDYGLQRPLVWNDTLYAGAVTKSSNPTTLRSQLGVVYWDGRQWLKLGTLNGYVEALTIHQNKLYVGGKLSLAGQNVDLAYWDGTTWTALATVINNNYLVGLASYQNELYVAGDPLVIDGQTYQNIARWNGSQWREVGTGIDGITLNLLSAADGLYAGGALDPINGENQGGIVRWDGTQWHDVGGGVTGYVMDLQLVDNQLIIGGGFTSTTNLSMHNVAAWNGTSWNSFGTGIDNQIASVLMRSDGLYALGRYNGIGVPLYVWNGTNWTIAAQAEPEDYTLINLPPYSLVDFENQMYALGDLKISGEHNGFNRLVWRADHWESMTPNGVYGSLILSNLGETIYGYASLRANWGSGRSALVRFDSVNGWQAIIKQPIEPNSSDIPRQLEVFSDTIFLMQKPTLYHTDLISPTWNAVSDQPVFGIASDQTKLYVAGDFSQFASVDSANLIIWDNGQWQAFAAPASFDQVTVVEALNGVVYISDGAQVARWDGTQWQTIVTGVSSIQKLEASAEGVYVAGTFSNIAGIDAQKIAYWNGSRWSALNGVINGTIHDLEMGADGLYVAGEFKGITGGVLSPGILRWNGVWNSVGGGVDRRYEAPGYSYVKSLAATPTRMYLGGLFDTVGNTYESSSIAAWNYGEPGWVAPTYMVFAPFAMR